MRIIHRHDLTTFFIRLNRQLFAVIIILLLNQSPLFALKVPIPPEQLKKQSALIVVGEVKSFQTEDRGSNKIIVLQVLVQSVEKGEDNAKIEDSIDVSCWKPVKPGQDGYFWEQGNEFIPNVGGRARFFLARQTNQIWESHWPNGVEALDAVPGIEVAREPADPVPALPPKDRPKDLPKTDASQINWPAIGAAMTAGMAVLLAWWITKNRRG